MLHGIQSHAGWYGGTAESLAEEGFNVRNVDRRGAGRNEIERGHAVHAQRLINDVIHFLNDAHAERAELGSQAPIALLGISWGGKLALALQRLRPDLIDRLVLITPGLFSKFEPSRFQRFQLGLAQRLGITHRQVPIPFADRAELFTSSSESQRFILEDPATLRSVTTSFLFASKSLSDIALRKTPIVTPLLMMLAGRDQIVDNHQIQEFTRRLAGAKQQIIQYKNVLHTLEFEPCGPYMLNDLSRWLLRK